MNIYIYKKVYDRFKDHFPFLVDETNFNGSIFLVNIVENDPFSTLKELYRHTGNTWCLYFNHTLGMWLVTTLE